MDDIAEIARRLDADRHAAAEAMTFEQRAMAGVAMFDLLVEAMRAGIRIQNPQAPDREVEAMLLDRLRASRRHEASA